MHFVHEMIFTNHEMTNKSSWNVLCALNEICLLKLMRHDGKPRDAFQAHKVSISITEGEFQSLDLSGEWHRISFNRGAARRNSSHRILFQARSWRSCGYFTAKMEFFQRLIKRNAFFAFWIDFTISFYYNVSIGASSKIHLIF